MQWVIPIVSCSLDFNFSSDSIDDLSSQEIFDFDILKIVRSRFWSRQIEIAERSEAVVLNNQKFYVASCFQLNNQHGGCSSMAERAVVVRVTWVRFPPSAYTFAKFSGGQDDRQ